MEQNIGEICLAIKQQFQQHNIVVVTAPTGAGKSTVLPLQLLKGTGAGERILMLEPRRLAARQIAERMAHTLGERTGDTVGYRVRFDNKVSGNTRLEILTEGILTRRLVADPMLEGVSMVIFDEFHERNLASDVALALTREAQQIVRPDLKILIMSATIDTTQICRQLHAPLVEMHSRQFTVEVRHTADDIGPNSRPAEVAQCVARAVGTAHRQHAGDILAFLPGQAEIAICQELLEGKLAATDICPLYGLISIEQQHQAIMPAGQGRRKVILATPIAETSLTIQGVRVVVDSGLHRKLVFNPQSGLSHLATARISLDMAAQRTGRAGRVADGVCYRLWSLATEHRMDACRTPEIEEADLSSTCLDVLAWGADQIQELPWLTPPPAWQVAQASKLLRSLGAVGPDGKITPHGRQLSQLPCHPRVAKMLTAPKSGSVKALAADVAAILEEKDPMAQNSSDTDINSRIIALREMRRNRQLSRGWQHIARIAQQYRNIVKAGEQNDIPNPLHTGLLLALAYPERIAMAHSDGCGKFTLASGDMAMVEQTDELAACDWIAVGSVNARSGKIFLASPFDQHSLADGTLIDQENSSSIVIERDNISWDNKRGQLVARHERRIGALVCDSRPVSSFGKEQATQIMCQAAKKHGTSMLDFNDKARNMQQRVATVAAWHPELELPSLDTSDVLSHCDEWLPLWLETENGQLRTSVNELRKLDVSAILWSMLTWEQQQQVDLLAPTHIKVPTGSSIRVEYRQSAELPVLRVRLQECFGLEHTPRVDNGKRAVLMELLSPGFKPVQLTQDLHSFWQNTYFEVRKELRRRYPKHAWPDNPLEAQAVRGVKKHSARK